jgi:hypothetical protein
MTIIHTFTNSHLFGETSPWLEHNIGPVIWVYGGSYSDPGSWLIYEWLADMLEHLSDTIKANDIHHIAYRSGVGWQSFICIPRYKLNHKDMQPYLIVDIEDEAIAVQFKLTFQ